MIKFYLSQITKIVFAITCLFIFVNTTSAQFVSKDTDAIVSLNKKADEVLQLQEVPNRYKAHPEFGLSRLSDPDRQDSYELIHERTIDSRLFQNLDGSYTLVQAGEPMHYKNADGWWQTIEVIFEEDPLKPHLYHLNKQSLPISFDAKAMTVTAKLDAEHKMIYGNNLSFLQFDNTGTILKKQEANNVIAQVDKDAATVITTNLFNGIDKTYSFDFDRIKTNYEISSPTLIHSNAKWVVFGETVHVPKGWSLAYDIENGKMTEDTWQGDLVLKNKSGRIMSRFHKPVYVDSGTNRNINHTEGSYKIEKIDETTYSMFLMISASWLLDPVRVYPVIIDPVATVDNGTVIATCLDPTYQQSTLNVAVTSGSTITNTYLLWEFTAVNNGAWIDDQRSYVSGPNGQTGVFFGNGSYSGTQTYTINTTIANGTSTGSVPFNFFSARVWPINQPGCNTTYNYINRRRIEVTYNTGFCNNFQNEPNSFHSNVNSSGYAPCGSWATTSTIGPGQHQMQYVHLGSSYSVNTCGTWTTFDTEISSYQGGSAAIYYNDDSGTACSVNGLTGHDRDSWVDWTASFQGWLQIQITRYSCLSWTPGIGSAILRVRENPPGQPATPILDPPGGSYCAGSNVVLQAVGAPPVGVTWYWQTTPLGTSTVNSGNTFVVANSGTYYVRPRSGSECWGTASAGVAVTFYNGVSNNTISANQNICTGTSPNTLIGSAPDGGLGAGTYTYGWQYSIDGGTTWDTAAPPNNGINYSPVNLTTTTQYRRWVLSGPCPANSSNIVTITVDPAINPGIIASNQSICYNTSPAVFTGNSATGGNGSYSYQWQQQANCSGGWTNISGATDLTYNHLGNLTQTTCYRRNVSAGVCPSPNSNVISVTVYPDLTSGTIGSNQTICHNTSPTAFSSQSSPSGGTGSYNYQWQQQANCSGGWADITGANALTYNFTGNLTQTTCYRRIVTSGICGPVSSNTVQVTVYADLTPGTVGTSHSICFNTTPNSFTNIASPSGGSGSYSYQWQQQPNCGGAWANISGATSSTYAHPSNLIQTTCFRRRVVNACGTVYSNEITVTVYPNITSGSIGSNQSICQGTSPVAFTNVQLPTGGTGPFTYQWQMQAGCSGGWSDITGAVSLTYNYPGSLTQTTCFRRVAVNACGTANSTPVIVTVYAPLTGGSVASNQTICSGSTPASFTSSAAPTGGQGSYTYQWQMTNVSGCGSGWANIPSANSNIYAHGLPLTETTCFRRLVTDPCQGPVASNFVTVTVNPLPILSINGLAGPYCIDQTTPVSLTGTPSGGTFSGNGIQGNDFIPYYAVVGTNTISYTYTDGNLCTNTLTQDVEVVGLPLVNFTGLSGTYCADDNTPKPLTGFPAGGTFTGPGISGNNFVPSAAGAGFHQISYSFQDGNGCINTQTQSVHVSDLPSITIIGLAPSYCIDYPVATLTGFPSGGTFSGPGISGNTFNPAVAGVGTHNISYSFMNGYGCMNTTIHQTIVYPSPTVSFSGLLSNYCENNAPVPLTGVPAGGTFSGIGVSGNNFFPSITGVGTFNVTYTYTNDNNCTNSSTQPVTVGPAPVVTSVDSIATCSGQSVNYNITSSLPSTSYTWTSNLIIGSATGFSNGSGTTINDILINNSSSAAIVRYIITPTYAGPPPCTGGTFVLLVYVRPYPTLFAGNDALVCSNSPYTITDSYTDSTNTILWTHNGLGSFNATDILHPTYTPSTTEFGDIMLFMTVTNPLGCPKTDTIILTIDFAPIADAGGNQIINCGGTGTTLGSLAQANYIYNWSPALGLNNPNIAQPNANPFGNTTYVLMVTDTINGCVDYDTITVTVSGVPVADAGPDHNINCNSPGVTLGTPGSVGLIYSWIPSNTLSNPNIAQPTATPQSTTTYQLTVTDDATGCYATDNVVVTIIDAPIADAGPDQSVICGGNIGVVIGSSSVPNMAYNWQPTTGLSNPNIPQPTANPLSNTTYVLTVTDLTSGCFATDEMIVTVIGAPVANAGLDKSIDCDGPGSMIGTPGSTGLSYNWIPATGLSDPNIAQPIATPLGNTTYTLIVTDIATGCFGTDEMTVTVVGAPTANAGYDQSILCGGAGTTIGTTAIGGLAYNWSPTTGLSDPNIAEPSASPLGNTTYTLTVTEIGTGCYATDNVSITVIGAPNAYAGLDQSIDCGGPGTQIGSTAVIGMAYNWIPATGLNDPNIAEPMALPYTHTNYTLIVTDNVTGCYAIDDVFITVIGAPFADAGPNQTINCGGPGAVIGTGTVSGMSYTWAPPYALSATNIAQPTASPLGNTTYYVTVTDDATGCYDVDSITITVAGAPVANAGLDQSISCGGAGVFIGTNGIGGMSYVWTPPYALSNANIAQPTATPLGNTTYYLTVTDDVTGCFGTDVVNINVTGTPVANAGVNKTIPCGGPGVNIGTSGITGHNYTWDPQYGLDDYQLATPLATPYSTTVYTLTVTEQGSGCFATDNMTLTVAGLPMVNAGLDATVCANEIYNLINANSSNAIVDWTHNGIGNLQDATTLSPTYYPLHNEFGTITLTLTAICNTDTARDNMSLTIYPYPVATFSELDSAYCIDNPGDTLLGYPAGGVFSGTGIVGNQFIPSVAGPGTYSITYTYTDANGCIKDTTKNTIVNPLPVVSFTGLNSHYCIYGAAFLMGSPTGGTFSGAGIIGNFFFPDISGDGTFDITYTYTDVNGCTNSQTQQTTVTPETYASFSGLASEYCIDDNPALLNGMPAGGTYSGIGIVGNTFDPAVAGVGFHEITYYHEDVHGCVSEYNSSTTVHPLPVVYISGLNSNYCVNSPVVPLTGLPASGTFSGPGISGNNFDPATAGAGTHTISYTFIDANFCVGIAQANVIVHALTPVSFSGLAPSICINSSSIPLTGSPVNGTFSGNGIVGNFFHPYIAGVGTTDVTYTHVDGNGCVNSETQTTTVQSLTPVSLSGLPAQYCVNAPPLSLSGMPAVGTFTGNGMSGNTFNPTVAGVGIHTIIYTYTDGNNCTNADSATVQVLPLPNVSFVGLDVAYCIDAAPITLTGFPASGTFTGAGITTNIFDPGLAGAGIHDISYAFTDNNGCTDTHTVAVIVYDLPVVTLGSFADVCHNDAQFTLTGGLPLGGTYTGTGVNNNIFNPSAASPGTHAITYTFQDTNTCINSSTQNITVIPPEILTITGLNNVYCVNEPTVDLTGTPTGGYFIGNGITGNQFNPANAGIGTHNIGYVFDGTQCSDTIYQAVTILPLPQVDIAGLDTLYCIDDAPVSVGGLPNGGTFSGPGMSGNIFTPANAGVGIHEINYAYTDALGCTNTALHILKVVGLPMLVFTPPLPDVCMHDAPFVLINGYPAGGTYSGVGVYSGTYNPLIAGGGDHIVTYTYEDAYGCVNQISDALTVFVNPSVSFDLNITDICSNDQAFDLIEGIPAGGTYSGNGVISNSFVPPQSNIGIDYVYYTYADPATGCATTDSSYLKVHQAPTALTDNDITICEGSTINLVVTGGDFYLWNTNQPQSEITVSPVSSTQYSVIAYAYVNNNDFLCSDTALVNISVIPLPEVVLTSNAEDNIASFGQEIIFTANPSTYEMYEFYVNNNLVQAEIINTYITNSLQGNNVIIVIAKDDNCISNADSLNIRIKSVANAFTPNNDGKNDIFMKSYDLQIFNRWGQLLYEGYEGWDGTYNGELLPGGTYFYVARIFSDDRSVIRDILKGSVLLIRED